MNFTFGIITSGQNDTILPVIIDSIIKQSIPHYEIIVIGSTTVVHPSVKIIPFDESIKPNWITRKKNIICEQAIYENIVLLHDYVALCDGWYTGFLEFGSEFDICTTKIKTIDGRRFRDYNLFPFCLGYPYDKRGLLPYDYNVTPNINNLMYISGAYFVIKKHIALKYPWNEELCWNQGDDYELCKRLTDQSILLKCNSYSTVQLQKYKEQCEWENELTTDDMVLLQSLSDNDINHMNNVSKYNMKNYITQSTGKTHHFVF
jgi:hypothetical protein